ncbi:unnamed protein product, partial [Hymenolepis diminuta]
FRIYEITDQKVQLSRLLKDLTPAVFELVHDVLGKPSTTPYDDVKFVILQYIEEPKLEFSKGLRKKLINEVTNGPQPQKRYNSEPNPPQTDSDDSSSSLISQKRNLI